MAALQQRDYSAAAEVMLASPLFQVPDTSRALVRSMVTENDKLWTIPRELMTAPRPAAERLERVQTPTLVLVGDRDLGAQREQAEVLSRRIPSASLVVVPGGGHMLNLTSPAAFRDLVATFLASSRASAQTSQQAPHSAEHHEFVIDNFKTESGVTLPKARIVYGTYGKLNAARDNAVLLPSHYMATHHGYEWLIGPDRALDTGKLFLVATELFGNGYSSSPSNTPEPFHGPRFPVTTIRDNVDAVHRLLAEELKVTHVRAVIGFSMGAQQAFQWAVSYPDFADRIVATAGTAKTWPHGVVRLEGQIAALTADPAFNGGDYTAPPRKGIEAYGMVWLGWLYSQEWWRREMWKINAPDRTLEQEIENRRRTFFANNDANDMILQARTWQRHNVGTSPGFNGDVERALRSITVPVLYMPSETDLYFPLGDARFEAQFIRRVSLVPIPSLWGHPAGAGGNPADRAFLNETISRFLAGLQ
jgi:homoserine O-acetyltransferase